MRPRRLSEQDLQTLFGSLEGASGVLAAVSGGPDSMAMLDLLARWAGQGGHRVLAATVDHGLRTEAAEEAALVERVAGTLGIAHRTLAWEGDKPRTGLQEAAREARYRLLVDLARREGMSHLVTAHTLDDQAETVLMRLSRGSGIEGVAGMRALVERDGILHARPLLSWRKAALVAYCEERGLPFVEDPSNANPRFARARWRKILPQLEAEGLTPERLGAFAARAADAEDALDRNARQTLMAARLGSSTYLAGPFADEPFAVAVRALALALAEAVPGQGRVRLHRLESCVQALRPAILAGRPVRRTLGGTVLSLDRAGNLTLAPEPVRHRGRYPVGEDDAAARLHRLEKGGSRA